MPQITTVRLPNIFPNEWIKMLIVELIKLERISGLTTYHASVSATLNNSQDSRVQNPKFYKNQFLLYRVS